MKFKYKNTIFINERSDSLRTKTSILNFITGVLPVLILSFIGLFKMKYFIEFLGDETLGLYQLFTQIMIYIALVDGGLTSAVLYALYKPNAEKDEKKVYEILLGARRMFNKIGIGIFVIATIISFIMPFMIETNEFENLYITGTFLLFAITNVITYFFIPSQVILEVKEKKYILNIIEQTGLILQGLTEIILLILGFNFVNILIIHIIYRFIISFIIYLYSKKLYKNPYKKLKPDTSFSKQVKHLLVHKINGLVGSNVDILIISSVFGLSTVAVYSAYNFIYNAIRNIILKISSSVIAIVGNYKHQTKELEKFFMEFNNLMFYIGIIICIPLALSISDFIDIWYEGTIKTNYTLGIAISLLLLTLTIKIPTTVFVNAFGLFKETKFTAICDTVINLSLSFLLVFTLGIEGVVLATVISVTISEYILKNKLIFNKIFNKSNIKYQLYNLKFFIIFIISLIVGLYITNLFTINNIINWTLFYIIYTIVHAIIIFIIFYILKAHHFVDRYLFIIKKKGRKI